MFNRKTQHPRRSPAGYQSANVYSYYASRSRADTAAGRHQQPDGSRRAIWKHSPSIISLVILAVCAAYLLTLSSNPKVRLFSGMAENQAIRGLGAYQEAAKGIMKSTITNRSKLTINTDGLAAKLKSEFPELESVSITIPLTGRRPIIEILPGKPALILIAKNGPYVLNGQGVAVIKLADIPKRSNLSIPGVTDESGLSAAINKTVLPMTTVNFITEVVAQLNMKKTSIADMTLPTVANELHVRISGAPYFVKFNLRGRARDQAGTLLATMQKLEADKITPAEYIDVRVDERAYYK